MSTYWLKSFFETMRMTLMTRKIKIMMMEMMIIMAMTIIIRALKKFVFYQLE